ncbi:uncharacterized protein LOC117320379 [Pecten maximus]|uniref:uncharacterized protein LOC117320379 n=1 Tax=Pecten maximus TaxID=6579 RepID=UPI00145836E9|nr:uncharacterized protein LOC117320379 [Pecten maximus]
MAVLKFVFRRHVSIARNKQDDYEIKGDSIISAEHEGPRKARTRSSPLFQDYSFILLNFDGDGKLSPDDITQIVENLGGKTSEKVDDSEGKCIALVYDDGDGSSTKDERILPFQGSTDISGTQCVTVSVFWLLDCVTTFSILEVEDYLYTFGKDFIFLKLKMYRIVYCEWCKVICIWSVRL